MEDEWAIEWALIRDIVDIDRSSGLTFLPDDARIYPPGSFGDPTGKWMITKAVFHFYTFPDLLVYLRKEFQQ